MQTGCSNSPAGRVAAPPAESGLNGEKVVSSGKPFAQRIAQRGVLRVVTVTLLVWLWGQPAEAMPPLSAMSRFDGYAGGEEWCARANDSHFCHRRSVIGRLFAHPPNGFGGQMRQFQVGA